jgi:FemAB-related protein (PEP-CTERM system-associated)
MSAESKLQVRVLTAADDAARDQYVEAHPEGTFFHLSGWRRAVVKVFGHTPHDLGVWRGDVLVGILPLFACKRPLQAPVWVSTAYAVYGGPLASDAVSERALVDAAVAAARAGGAAHVDLRTRFALADDTGLVPQNLYATFRKSSPATIEEVQARMPRKARAEVRKAVERHGLVLVEGPEHLDALVRLFAHNKKSLGSPSLPRRWFQALLEEYGERVVVHAVQRPDGELLAASMSFVFHDELDYYYLGVTEAGNREYSASNYLAAVLQERCVAQGLSVFDFGRSRVDTGPYRFKVNQGFEPTPLPYRFALLKARELPSFNPSNPKTEGLRRTWTKLPDWVTDAASGVLMRWLP